VLSGAAATAAAAYLGRGVQQPETPAAAASGAAAAARPFGSSGVAPLVDPAAAGRPLAVGAASTAEAPTELSTGISGVSFEPSASSYSMWHEQHMLQTTTQPHHQQQQQQQSAGAAVSGTPSPQGDWTAGDDGDATSTLSAAEQLEAAGRLRHGLPQRVSSEGAPPHARASPLPAVELGAAAAAAAGAEGAAGKGTGPQQQQQQQQLQR